MRPSRLPLLALLLALGSAPAAHAACNTTGLADGTRVAELVTPLGSICFELLDADAPITTANFVYYLENGLIADTFFHRSVPGFVIQGGGYTIDGTTLLPDAVTPRPGVTVTNEPCTLDTPYPGPPAVMICSERGNVRGTVSLAKAGGDPNSGTTNWFINLGDNRPNLDNQNGGFTVFARVFQGMDVVDAIAALTRATRNDLVWQGSSFGLATAQNFTFTAPLRNPLLYDVAGQYGCWDPEQQVTILNPQPSGNPPTAYRPVVDPIDPTLLYHTLSSTCGTPTTRATFVADPGTGGCTDVDRIGVATDGPVTLSCMVGGQPSGNCSTSDHFEFTCQQAADGLAQRELWRQDFQEHFVQQLVYVTSATLTTVPEPDAVGGVASAAAALAALARRRGRAGAEC
jgi:cyclophilin family peptidyl-prolyl cis-trans isomerase